MLDQLDLVHMNGRVYDPYTARFLTADPLIQDPVNGQSYNRYSYVLNNPTNWTDPTGFEINAPAPQVIEVYACGFFCRQTSIEAFQASWARFQGSAAVRTSGGVGEQVGKYLKGEWQQLKNDVNYDLDHPGETFGKLAEPFGAGGMVAGTIGKSGKFLTLLTRLLSKEEVVWDSIKATQPVWQGTVIPRSFELATGNVKVWVHGNATEHLAEYATAMLNKGMSREAVNLGSQMQLTSLQSAVREATALGVPLNKLVNAGGWELKFSQKATDNLPALIHAMPVP